MKKSFQGFFFSGSQQKALKEGGDFLSAPHSGLL
jgi:hypothetical protein